jgi:mRNA-degrading endonuclease RelE of RelBE toxin-antitoxin system
MRWEVVLTRSARKDLTALSKDARRRIDVRLLALEDDPFPRGVKKLKGNGDYRIAVGSYRIIYMIEERSRTVTVRYIRHRREAYR